MNNVILLYVENFVLKVILLIVSIIIVSNNKIKSS